MIRGAGRALLFCLAWGVLGVAWPQASPPPAAFKAPSATRAPLFGIVRIGPRVVAVGDYGVVLLSDDYGATWRQARSVATGNGLTAVAFADAARGWAVGHGGTVLHTADGGASTDA